MKKLIFSCIFFISLNLSAQDIYVSFSPKKAGAAIDSAFVTNLRTNQKVQLTEGEQLLLTQPKTGIAWVGNDPPTGSIYPNPSNTDATLEFSTLNNEMVKVAVYNTSGQLLMLNSQKLLTGRHNFLIRFPAAGTFFVSVQKMHDQEYYKVICREGRTQQCSIVYNGSGNRSSGPANTSLKSLSVVKTMYYQAGDILYCSAYSGKNNTIITDSPTLTKAYAVEFFNCIDFEKYSYPIVKIGNQWWMAKNLQSTKYTDGTTIAIVTDNSAWSGLLTGAYCWYNNNAAQNKPTYGALYNWQAVNSDKICPTGWHLPYSTEWAVLENSLGGVNQAGGKMKKTTAWDTPNTLASNSSGFSALPGGSRTSEGFYNAGNTGFWWSASESSINNASRLKIVNNLSGTERINQPKINGYSVRCIKNDPNLVSAPTVITDSISETSLTEAFCGGNVSADGGAAVTARGVCWSTSPYPTISNNKSSDGNGQGTFKSILSGLAPNTTYFVRAYATNSVGTAYGNQIQFSTSWIISAPIVITSPVSGITQSSAVSGGNVTSDGAAGITGRGVCWSTSPDPTVADSKTSNGTGMGSFTSNITGLTPVTTYYLRAYAVNNIGTAYGSQVSFTTSQLTTTPTVSTGSVTSITQTSAICSGNVTANGGAAVTARGICWNTSPNPTVGNSKTSNGTGTGSFSGNLTGLTQNTTYYCRAYATNNAGTSYGSQVQFKTKILVLIPTVATGAVTSVTQTSAVAGGNVTNDGGATVTARGVCWSTAPDPTISGSKTLNGTGTGTFTGSITGLVPGTTYFIRAYATNSAGTAYGTQVSVTTSQAAAPTLSTRAVSAITQTAATSGGIISSDGGVLVTARGVCWGTGQNPTVAGSKSNDGTGTGNYTSSITGLTASTTYFVRAYATNSVGTAYGNQVTFTTSIQLFTPTVSTGSVSSVGTTTAVSGGTVNSDGGSGVTARGICWSTGQNPTTANNKTSNGTGTGSFTSNLTGLSPNTTYYVRAYATNSIGTAYGSQVQFTTIIQVKVPTVTTTLVTGITQTSAASGGNVTADGGASVTTRGVCYSTSANPTIANSFTSNGTGTGSFISNILGLLPGTTYYLRAYATNSAGTGYGSPVQFTTNQVIKLPTVSTTSVTTTTLSSVTLGGEITDDGGAAVTARGICWSTSPYPTLTGNYTSNGGGTGIFSATISGLAPNTTYYARAYATNSSGTSYGNQVQFRTAEIVTTPVVSTSAVNVTTQTSAVSGGTVVNDGGSTVTARGVCWSTSPGPTIAGSKTTNGTGVGTYSSTLTGLTANTTYYFRAYATNSMGTSYGEELTFKTLR